MTLQGAIKQLHELGCNEDTPVFFKPAIAEVINVLLMDAKEVRHGRWIKDKNLYKCTACNDLLTVAGWADSIPEKQIYKAFKYCPNCGARMDLEENDD